MKNKLFKRIEKNLFIFKIFILVLGFVFNFIAVIGNALVYVEPTNQTVSPNQNFLINIYCNPEQPIKSFEFKLSFNPSLLKANSVIKGNIFNGYKTFFNPGFINNAAGKIINIQGIILGKGNVINPGILATISFTAKTSLGTSLLHIYDLNLTKKTNYIPITVFDGNVTINSSNNSDSDGNSINNEGVNILPIDEKNNPPDQPIKPSGSTFIKKGVIYKYSSYAADIDGHRIKLMFDWGDGNVSSWSDFVTSNTTISMSHSWEEKSNYYIKVIAQDEKGTNSSWSEPLIVNVSELKDDSPYMEIKTTILNETIFFDASGCYDPNADIVSYQWDFGDGENIISTNKTITHIYKNPGDYTVTLIIRNDKGDTYNTSIYINAEEIGLQKKVESFSFFYIFNIFICMITISILFVFKDMIIISLSDTYIYLFRHKKFNTKNRLYNPKPIWETNKINYYSTVVTPPFSVKKSDYSKYIPKILHDHRFKKEKSLYYPNQIYKEEKSQDEYNKFNIGDKIDKLIKNKNNLKTDNKNPVLEEVKKEIDGLYFLDKSVNYLEIEKEVDNLIFSKLIDKIDRI